MDQGKTVQPCKMTIAECSTTLMEGLADLAQRMEEGAKKKAEEETESAGSCASEEGGEEEEQSDDDEIVEPEEESEDKKVVEAMKAQKKEIEAGEGSDYVEPAPQADQESHGVPKGPGKISQGAYLPGPLGEPKGSPISPLPPISPPFEIRGFQLRWFFGRVFFCSMVSI